MVSRSLGFAVLVAVIAADVVAQPAVRVEIGPPSADQKPTLPPAPDEGGAIELPREHHAWTRRQLGAFRTLVNVTETLDERGQLASRTETEQIDRLVGLSGVGYTLQSSTTLSVGGVSVPGPAEAVTYNALTDSAGAVTSVVELEPAEFAVGGRSILCRRWRLSTEAGPRTTLETVWYSAEHPPYVLRRDRTVTESSGSQTTEVTETVTQIGTPVSHNGQLLEGCVVEVRTQLPAGRIDRVELRCDAAPGGLVSAWTTERNSDGRRTRWSVTTLADSGDEEGKTRRRRWRRLGRRAD